MSEGCLERGNKLNAPMKVTISVKPYNHERCARGANTISAMDTKNNTRQFYNSDPISNSHADQKSITDPILSIIEPFHEGKHAAQREHDHTQGQIQQSGLGMAVEAIVYNRADRSTN